MQHKRAAVIAAVALLIGIAVVLALPYLVDVNQYRGQVQTAIQDRLGREVTLGEMRLSLLPPGVRVADVVIAEDPALRTERPFASIAELYVSPRLLPLLTGRFELRAVELRQPTIELVRTAAGAWNFSTLGASGDAAVEPAGVDDSEQTAVVLNRLSITDGQVALTDLQKASGRAIYDNIDVRLEDFAPDRPFDMAVTVTLPGEGTQRLSVSGTGGPIVQDDVMMTPFDGTIDLDGVSVSGVQQFLQLEALEGTDSVISGSASLRNENGRLASEGSLTLEETLARGVSIDYPIAAEFDVAHDTPAERLTIARGTIRLGQTPLSLTGTVHLQPEVPELDVHVTASDASLSEAARLASAFGVAFGAGTEVEGTLDADVRARGPATLPSLDGQLQLRDVAISGDGIPQPVRTQAVNLTLTPDEIQSNEFTVGAGGTSVSVRGAVRQYTSPTPTIDARIRTADADVGEMLNVAHAWGVEAAEGMRGTGRLSLDVQATGPLDALTYSGSGSLSNATFHTPTVAEPLNIRSVRLSFKRDAAVLENLAASLGKTTAEGRLSVRSFTAPQVDFALSANTIDVAQMQQILGSGADEGAGAPQGDEATTAARAGDGLLRKTTGSGTIQVGSIVYNALVLENVQATATLDRGLIRLDPLTAMLFGGQHRGAIAMDARTAPPTFAVASSLEQVDANRLASAMTSLQDVIYGALGSQVRMQFTSAGADSVARTLNGTMAIKLGEGRIANMNLTQEIGNIARFVSGQPAGERSTQVAGLSGSFDVSNGVARTEDLVASLESGTLGAQGTINLVDQSLNLRVTAVLSREFSQRVGGSSVGGFLTTALANQQGELVIPMIVTGTAQQPRFAPDAKQVAEMKLRNLVPSLRDPQSLTGGILGALGGSKPQEGGSTGGRIGDIVGAITGKQAPEGEQAKPDVPPEEQKPKTEQPRTDPESQIRDALKGILGGRQKEAPEQ